MKNETTAKPNSSLNNKTGGWRTFVPRVDLEKCVSCGMCEKVCPEGVAILKKNPKYNQKKPQIDLDFCKGCGVCAQECPVKAIKMELEEK